MRFLFVRPEFCPSGDLSTPKIRLSSDSASRRTPLPLTKSSRYRATSGLSPYRTCAHHVRSPGAQQKAATRQSLRLVSFGSKRPCLPKPRKLQRTRGQAAVGQKKRPVALPCNIRIMRHNHHSSLQFVSQLTQAMDHDGRIVLVQRPGRLIRKLYPYPIMP